VLSERYHREKPKSMSGELQEVEHYTNVNCYLVANILKGPYHYTLHFPGYSELNEVLCTMKTYCNFQNSKLPPQSKGSFN